MISIKRLPLAGMDLRRINSPFGMRIHPITGQKSMHYGVDYPAPRGTPIYATADGTVQISKMQSNGRGYGEYVVIDHGLFATLSCHMSERLVSVGKRVRAGDMIGRVGSTGDSTGNHLHFGMCYNFIDTSWFDPLPLLKGVRTMNEEHWGKKYLDSLVEKGLILNPELHKDTLEESLTKAEIFALIDRLTDKV